MEEDIERQLEHLRLEREEHSHRMNALHEACQESLSMRGVFNFPTFKGDDSEDVHDFINTYTRAAEMCGWTKEKQAKALPLYLKGSASVWFNSLPNKNTLNLDEMTTALVDQFSSGASEWRLQQMLNEREQRESETVSAYTTDIRQQCNRLGISLDAFLHHYIRGLKQDIKEYVGLQRPSTFKEAENLAKLKEVLSSESKPAQVDTKKLSQDIIKELKGAGIAVPSNHSNASYSTAAIATSPIQGTTASSFSSNYNAQDVFVPSVSYPSLPTPAQQCHQQPSSTQQYQSLNSMQDASVSGISYPSFSMPTQQTYQYPTYVPQQNETEPDIRQVVRDEMKRQRSFNDNRNNRGNRNFGRRTRTGVVICGFCSKPGHAMYNCRMFNSQSNQNQGQFNYHRNRNQNQNQNRASNKQFPVRSNNRNQGQPQGN
jgi:hypothetical protein